MNLEVSALFLGIFLLSSQAGAQLQSSVERPCPGERVTFTCTVPSVAHRWSVPSLDIARSLLPGDLGRVMSDPPFQFSVTEVRTNTSITSTATVNITADLNGTLVVCQDGIGMLPDQNITIYLTESNDEQCVTLTPTPTPVPPTASSPTSIQLPLQTPTQPPPQTTTGLPVSGGANAGAIAGVVIGGLIGAGIVVLIIIIIVYLVWRKKNSPRPKDTKPKWAKKRHSTEATPNTQEELLLDLTYEEVDTLQSQTIRLEKNVAYVPVKQSQKIVAHGPVKRN